MDVATLEQFAADGLTGATFEKHIIRNDDGCAAVHLEKAHHPRKVKVGRYDRKDVVLGVLPYRVIGSFTREPGYNG